MAFLATNIGRQLLFTQRRNAGQLKKSVEGVVAYYNDVIGITEVTKAKSDVIQV
jgi:hypothetical protein